MGVRGNRSRFRPPAGGCGKAAGADPVGAEFSALIDVLPWLWPAFLVRFFAASWASLTSAGQQRFRAIANLFQWVVVLACAVWLVPRWGVVAWVWCLVLGNLILAIAIASGECSWPVSDPRGRCVVRALPRSCFFRSCIFRCCFLHLRSSMKFHRARVSRASIGMGNNESVEKVVTAGLCTGCGLCESLGIPARSQCTCRAWAICARSLVVPFEGGRNRDRGMLSRRRGWSRRRVDGYNVNWGLFAGDRRARDGP